MKKKLLSLLLALILVVSVTVIMAAAEETTPAGHTDHCVCGGDRNGRGDHKCGAALTDWIPFSEDLLVATANQYRFNLPAGNYYLTGKTVLTGKEINILADTEVTFCLNGFEITSSRRLFRVNGTLNITDCYANGNGKIIGNSGNAAVAYGYSGGHINLYGGILTGKAGVTRNYGAVIALATDAGSNASSTAGSSMTMYGGTIDASKLTLVKNSEGKQGSGGAMILMGTAGKPCTFIQYGGTIKGAKSVETNGAAISCTSNDTIKILGLSNIDKGDALGLGDGIYATKDATVVVGGSANIEDIYIPGNQTITAENLTDTVGISADRTNGYVLVSCDTAASAANIVSNVQGRPLQVNEVDGKFQVKFTHGNHCECGGNLTGVAAENHTCAETLPTWTALTAENIVRDAGITVASDRETDSKYNMFAKNGHYYLSENIDLANVFEIRPNQDITICLNGYRLTNSNKQQSVFRVTGGKLNICDCIGTGEVYTAYTGVAPVLYLLSSYGGAEGVEVNLYGGTLRATDTNYNNLSGVVQVGNSNAKPATLNIYGGTIKNGTSYKGGCIYINSASNSNTAVVNMYGGEVLNGKVRTREEQKTDSDGNTTYQLVEESNYGGNIFVNYGQFNMYAGTVSGGTTSTTVTTNLKEALPGVGADIYLNNSANASATLDGAVTIGEIGVYGTSSAYSFALGEKFASAQQIAVTSLKVHESGYVMVAKQADYAMKNLFIAKDAENFQVTAEGASSSTKATIRLRAADVAYGCRCGGYMDVLVAEAMNHICTDILWTDLTLADLQAMTVTTGDALGGDCYTLPKGNYKLVEDITSDKAILIPFIQADPITVNLDLNGHTLTVEETAKRVFVVRGMLNLSDSAYDPADENAQWGKVVGASKNSGAAVYVAGLKKDSANKEIGGKMFMYGGELTNAYTEGTVSGPLNVSGVIHMAGGQITGLTKTTANGAAIAINDGGIFTLWAGKILGGEAKNGGAIYANVPADKTFTQKISIRGGIVTGGSAQLGGNIYVGNRAELIIANGTVSDGTATAEGGNIYAAELQMSGGVVSGGTSASYGGNIYLAGASKISGGEIYGGVSTSTSRSGGNICVSGKSTLTISGGKIYDGIANEGGNLSVRDGSTINISGGEIYNGQAMKHGGNIVAYTTLNISGGKIYGGKAVNRGGNISTYGNYGKITITGGEIRDGILLGNGETAAADLYGANISMLSVTDRPLELTILGGNIGGFGDGCVEGVSSVHIQSSGDEITTIVGGTAVIDSLRLGTGRMLTVHEDGFAEGAAVGIERFEVTGLFAPGADAEYAQYFHGTAEGTGVAADETGLIITSSIPYWAFNASHNAIGAANTIAEAMALEGATYVRLVKDYTTNEVINGDVYLDLYGYDLTGLTVNGTANIIDYKTINYEDGVCGSLIGFTGDIQKTYTTDGVTFNGKRSYIAIENADGSYSFHCFKVAITHISLDAGNDALGFKATVSGDSAVQAAVTGFGFNMGIEGGNMKTYTLNENHGADGVFTLRLKGIMAAGGGEMPIIGEAFILFGEETVTGAQAKTSMKDTIVAVNTAWDSYTADQQAAVKALYDQYADTMAAWLGADNKIVPPAA